MPRWYLPWLVPALLVAGVVLAAISIFAVAAFVAVLACVVVPFAYRTYAQHLEDRGTDLTQLLHRRR